MIDIVIRNDKTKLYIMHTKATSASEVWRVIYDALREKGLYK